VDDCGFISKLTESKEEVNSEFDSSIIRTSSEDITPSPASEISSIACHTNTSSIDQRTLSLASEMSTYTVPSRTK